MVLAAALLLSATAHAYVLSPGLALLESDSALVRCVTADSALYFTEEDFDRACGIQVSSVIITELPAIEAGTLKLGATDVLAFQSISRADLKYLRFIPQREREGEVSFYIKFTQMGAVSAGNLRCSIHVLEEANSAPVSASATVVTQKNMAITGTVATFDADGDEVTHRLCKGPAHGTVSLTDAHAGNFVYVPDATYVGADSFVLQAEDLYGNPGKAVTVTVTVERPVSALQYEDMQGHWAHYAAVKLGEAGIMTGEQTSAGMVFGPDRAVTRGEFMMWLLGAAGLRADLTPVTRTVFADDEVIPVWMKKYAAAAYEAGIVLGKASENGPLLCADDHITRAEAAVMIDRTLEMLELPAGVTFADHAQIPAWAQSAFANLSNLGILQGSGGHARPMSLVDRAQAASLLWQVSGQKQSQSGWSLFDLFS